ncbi:uncharacterized protein LOC128205559 isoform X2 [Mya arenaria]|uniref:uncharacterized protein LOC128205559 isoform X2 n=1 Tax=Mya arenaria TaxID=6604 RepID=UPI0022E92335|nr:uncharacterized protein LOC128205559 isoform X2 [Mya arenaria]
MATEEAYIGTWKIVECVSLAGTVETTGIEGTEFNLDESGDVSWKVSDDVEPLPFFNCETFEVNEVVTGKGYGHKAIKFIGTYAGLEVNFQVEISDDLMLLTYERCCMLQCQKISSPDPKDDIPYSFLGALEEGFFSDLTITGESGKDFHVHTTILRLTTPGIDWSKTPTPLTGLPNDVLQITLHYIYAECLPRGATEEAVRRCVKMVAKIPDLAGFIKLCNIFLENTALKQQITALVTDMHSSADKVIELFRGMKVDESSQMQSSSVNPARLCYITKQCLREAATALSKLLVLCDLFSRRKAELSREERNDIIKYARSRIPVFLRQWLELLEECKGQLGNLTPQQRHDLATYLVPEIEQGLELFTQFVVDGKAALELIISHSEVEKTDRADKHRKGHVGDVLGKMLKHALHVRELKKLKRLNERTTLSFFHFMQQKESFCTVSQAGKIRDIAKLFESLCDIVQISHSKVTEILDDMDDWLSWRDWKYIFKLATSKISWAICKVQQNQSMAQPLVKQGCDMVHRDEFSTSLTSLGLLANSASQNNQSSPSSGATPKCSTFRTKYVQLSSVESLSVSPFARDSHTAQQALKLLLSQKNTDLTFEIVQAQEVGDTVIDHMGNTPTEHVHAESEVAVCQVPAHRVVIAARCDWFKRALLSGMRESIDRKITVHDTDPSLFRVFLEYVYCGQVELNDLSTEQISDMMTLADRYDVVCLRSKCEYALKHHLDENTVFYLLTLADQLTAKNLKESCMSFLSENSQLSTCEVISDLPEHLQLEVEAVSLTTLQEAHSSTDTPSSTSSVSEIDNFTDRMNIESPLSSPSSSEVAVPESARLQECLEGLREVVGPDVPEHELVSISLAADCDLNRAINFFFL